MRGDRDMDNQQILQTEEKEVVSSVATVLSDLCGPGEWMPMRKLHTEQKIVIMVSMPCDKCRAKAMELAAKADGVISVGITGDYADRLEVVGDGVDPVCLVGRLRKKVGWARILHVEEVKAKKIEKLPECYPGCYHCPPVPQMVICDEAGASCSIM